MKINIKNMVCSRCLIAVDQILKHAGFNNATIHLGSATVNEEIPSDKLLQIEKELNMAGFEIINSRSVKLIEQIKSIIIDHIYNDDAHRKLNFSTILASKMNKDYNYLSTLFSSVENITIEHFIINLKIERVKELIIYDEKNLSEIAFDMEYSSVAHLSGQFKKVTGFTPSYFKTIGEQKRKSIDKI